MEWRSALLFAALLAPPGCLAAEGASAVACEDAYAALPAGTILDLLDPAAAQDRRSAALAAYQGLADMRECPEFGYTLGQLYRHGEYLPGNPLPQDVDKAVELIRPMAEDGFLPAFADLAEIHMRHARPREAMKWTQVYLHFVLEMQAAFPQDPDTAQYNRAAYNGNLLARTETIWRKLPRPALPRAQVKEDLHDYLAEHHTSVFARMVDRRRGLRSRTSAQDGGAVAVASNGGDCRLREREYGAGSAAWIVEVLPSGRTGRIVLENFVPSATLADALKACLIRYEFAPFVGPEAATVRISMTMGSPEGASMRRTRRR